MRIIKIIFIYFYLNQISTSTLILPPDILLGITRSSTGESGGIFVEGVDRDYFIKYICYHWREILDNVKDLPKSEGSFTSNQDAINLSFAIVGGACESLSPSEYLDFMDRITELCEQNLIAYDSYSSQLGASSKKQDFLTVNWEHPRVQAIFEKARKLVPVTDEATLSWLNEAARGELADNYMTNKSDDAPLPETLPRIKLERPWGSLIKKFELITGKNVTHDLKFDPRPSRRDDPSAESAATATQDQPIWTWLACVTALIAICFLIWRLRARRSARS